MLAFFIVSIFIAIALFHLYWAGGGTFGKNAAVPSYPGASGKCSTQAFKPSRIATVVVAVALLAVTATVAWRSGLLFSPQRHWALQWWEGGVATVMMARAFGDFRLIGFFKTVKGTQFAKADTWIFSPLCLALSIGLFLLAIEN